MFTTTVFHRIASRCTLFGLLMFVTSCTREWEHPHSEGTTHRTILAYIAADNNLSGEAQEKCKALLDGWHTKLGGLLIVADDGRGHPALLRATERGGIKLLDTLRTYSQENMADASLLGEAITDMPHYAPASCYGLVLFSHATGWLPAKAFTNPQKFIFPNTTRSIFKDKEQEMEVDDMAAVIPDGRFCFIVFDMCFMGSTEALYALRNKAHKAIVSAAEVLSPGFTPIYRTHLDRLYTPRPDVIGFASAFFDHWSTQEGVYRSATISVIDLHQLNALAALTQDLTTAHHNSTPPSLEDIQVYDRRTSPHLFFDLGDYLHALASSAEDRQRIADQMKRTVLLKRHTDFMVQLPLLRHSGLSIYVEQPSLPALNNAHRHSEWGKAITSR